MLSYELLHEIQEYIDENYIKEELTASPAPVPELYSGDIQYSLDSSIVLKEATPKISKVSGYNPENDFPIPEFLKAIPDLDLGKDVAEEKKELPKRKGTLFDKLKDLPVIEEFEDTEEDVDEEDACYSSVCASMLAQSIPSDIDTLRERLSSIDESFSEMLIKKIDSLGMTDADCYHKAQLNRSHFNKIKNDPNYHVQKETAFALALALSLDRGETADFLAKAGYAFSPSSKADLIIEYCINKGIYDVIEVNQLLYAFDQKLLGAGIRE